MQPIASRITAYLGRSFVGDHWEAVTPGNSAVMGTGTVLKQAWMRKDAGAAKLGTSSVGWEELRKQATSLIIQSASRFTSAATTSLTVQMELMKENVPSANLGPFTATVTGLYVFINEYTLLFKYLRSVRFLKNVFSEDSYDKGCINNYNLKNCYLFEYI